MTPQKIWDATYHQLKLQLDRANFNIWVRDAFLVDYVEAERHYIIGVPQSYQRDMLEQRLLPNVHRLLSDISGHDVKITFEVRKPADKPSLPNAVGFDDDLPLMRLLAKQQTSDAPSLAEAVQPRRVELPDSDLNPRYVFERFIVNKSNELVYQAARSVCELPGTNFNPLFVYSNVGIGKTHILQAIAHACVARGLRVLYASAETFTNDLIASIRHQATTVFRDKYRSLDVLIVDDVHFISGKESTQEEFFHTFNALVNFNKQVVLASDRHPSELKLLTERLRSRFQGGLVADIQMPEVETRLAILQMWAQEKSLHLPSEVAHMLAERAPNNIRELEGVFNHLVAQSRLMGNTVTLPRAEITVRRFGQPRDKLSLERIIEATAQEYGLTSADLLGKRRTGQVNEARQVAMYLARILTEYSLQQIGEALGNRAHTTIMHGHNKIAEDIRHDMTLDGRIRRIKHALRL
ncbi:MAG: chromosomal replication initiator protein DnaA [Anaerolineae bacterium]|nr:chromosomal replication initiator protein DnaA [Anaerolineae bacterium]MDW8172128.1 chromosomal replication initiator protein DnaA [Anaerolineae bacterium]